MDDIATQRCTKCTQSKPLAEFAVAARNGKRRTQCRQCVQAAWAKSGAKTRSRDREDAKREKDWREYYEAKADARTQAAFDRLRADRLEVAGV